jgi:hypothetical protein
LFIQTAVSFADQRRVCAGVDGRNTMPDSLFGSARILPPCKPLVKR